MPTRKAAPRAARKPAAATTTGGIDRFVAAVHEKLPDITLDRRDDEITDLGLAACDGLGDDRSATAATSVITAQGVAPADARTLVELAGSTLCHP